jgi:hypothetical protein
METTPLAILDHFTPLEFEPIPIEEGLTALCFEDGPEGEYALITNEEGAMPELINNPLILAFYTANGTFLWSTGFKNLLQFKEVWSIGATYAEKKLAAEKHRDQMIAASPLAKLLGGENK